MPEPELTPARFEASDVHPRYALIALPGVLLVLLACIMLVHWLYPHAGVDRRLPSPLAEYPSPQLQSDPQADMARFRKTELARLNSGGWDDQSKGEGHISIQDAMRRIAQIGIPDWPK